MASAKNRFILLLILAVAVLAVFTGCGGGGGDSGSTLDPDQLEVAAAVDAFSAAIRGEDFAAANSFPNSEVKWYRQDGTTWDNLKIQKSLKNFFDKATVKDFTISGIGVNVISDTVAESRGNLSLTYSDAAATDKTINESIKMVLEKAPGGPWGLIEFGVYGASDKGSAFPPEL
ncbi:hypothetical protein MASR1M12_44990 [Erysipelotrichia bacterium]